MKDRGKDKEGVLHLTSLVLAISRMLADTGALMNKNKAAFDTLFKQSNMFTTQKLNKKTRRSFVAYSRKERRNTAFGNKFSGKAEKNQRN